MRAKTLGRRRRIRRYWPLLAMMVPGLLYLLINNYLPLFGLVIAFKDINYSEGIIKGILNGPWVGMKNFEFLFRSQDAWIITRNTILYNLVFIVLNTAAAIALAICMKEVASRFFSRFFQSVLLFPNFISMVIVSYLVYAFLSTDAGFLNKGVLPLFGADPIQWYTSPQYWPFILVFVNLWKNVGMLSIVYFAALVGIDPQYYEAATLDGAGRWRQTRSITLPMISPVIIMMVLLSVGRMFYSDFGLFYQVPMDSGLLYDVTGTIDTYVFRSLIKLGDVGMASAAGVYQSVVGFVLVLASNWLVRKIDRDSALF